MSACGTPQSLSHVAMAPVFSQHPFRHIAEVLLKKSEEMGESKPGTRVSIGDSAGGKKAGFASGMPATASVHRECAPAAPFITVPCSWCTETVVVDSTIGSGGAASAGDDLNRCAYTRLDPLGMTGPPPPPGVCMGRTHCPCRPYPAGPEPAGWPASAAAALSQATSTPECGRNPSAVDTCV